MAFVYAASTPLNFRTSWRVGGGVEYEVNPMWLLRGGLAYDTTPVQDAFRTPRLPDEDRIWLAVGARYKPTPNFWLDLGYTHIWLSDANSNLPGPPPVPGTLVGKYKADIDIIGVQGSFRF